MATPAHSSRMCRDRRRPLSTFTFLSCVLPSLASAGIPLLPKISSWQHPSSLYGPPGVNNEESMYSPILAIRGGRQPAPRPGDIGRSSPSMPNGKKSRTRVGGRRRSSTSSPSPPSFSQQSLNKKIRKGLNMIQQKIPGIRIRVEPTTKLKLRKTFHPLGATVLKLGADFNAQLGVWQFRSSWEDRVIGGTLSVVGRELQIAKTWRLTVDQSKIGSREDLVTAVRFRAAVDLGTLKAYARFGFRTERISPINVYDGFTLTRRLPLDGKNERIKLEMKARFALPEPEIEYSTEASRSLLVGLGDVEVNIDELNLLLDY